LMSPAPAAAIAAFEGTNTVTPFLNGAVTVLVRFVEFSTEAKPLRPFAARVSERESGRMKKLF